MKKTLAILGALIFAAPLAQTPAHADDDISRFFKTVIAGGKKSDGKSWSNSSSNASSNSSSNR
ncbi:hypothetical protein [Aminobacter ciceronei]|nr:hypothetical protein [Aminobacter ciceronei]MBA8909274.1 hypothetical protein [Aminobacter ciceronei]MBA9023046.1 hypothetical protein [Aminobacter ciceronei]